LSILPLMTMADAGVPAAAPASRAPVAGGAPAAGAGDAAAVPRGCPFLLAEAGGWRLDLPAREHRCAAFTPPAPLSPEKQARLCLTPAHATCATYLASLAAREARLGLMSGDRATRWGLARTTSVIEDAGGLRARATTVLLDRRRWPAIPAVLLVATLATLALSGFRGEIPTTPIATSSPAPPSAAATTLATRAPSATPTAPAGSVGPSPEPSAGPTLGPSPSAAAVASPAASFRTYSVQLGDTLSGIASRFNTSVASLVNLNNLRNANNLTVGQVLLIP
jgi:LysM repeat protein